jgi:DNA-binding NarL/FixJ family response regulator
MSLKILLADDCATVRETIRGLLQRDGFDIVGEAMDGADAVRLVDLVLPDVVVLDCCMPHMTGIVAARTIRGRHPQMRLILLTTSLTEDHVLTGLDAGVRGFVVKSDAADDLADAIRRVWSGNTFVSRSAPPLASQIVQSHDLDVSRRL